MPGFTSRLWSILAAATFILSWSLPATAAKFDFSLGTGYLKGDSTYQIGGDVVDAATGPASFHFPISELMFPLDAVMVKAEVGVEFTDKLRLTASGQTNITDDTGKMEDSDWLFNTRQLDIFSESDTEMSAWMFEAELQYSFYSAYYGKTSSLRQQGSDLLFTYSLGLGYKHQEFDFDVSDLDQWYPSAPSFPHDRVAGLVATYEVDFQIPYVELSMEMAKGDRYSVELSFAYAPVINVEDEDHHLLRDKVNIADHDWNGDARFLTLKGRYNFNPSWYLTAELENMSLKSEGRSKAYFGGVWDHTIDHEVESDQLSAFLSIGYDF